VATLRKNVAVLWVPPAVKARSWLENHQDCAKLSGRRVGVIGRTQANVDLLKVILQQYGVDPAKVEIVQFPTNEAADSIRSQKADAYSRRSDQQQDYRRGDRCFDARRPFANLPRIDSARQSPKITRCMRRPKFRRRLWRITGPAGRRG